MLCKKKKNKRARAYRELFSLFAYSSLCFGRTLRIFFVFLQRLEFKCRKQRVVFVSCAAILLIIWLRAQRLLHDDNDDYDDSSATDKLHTCTPLYKHLCNKICRMFRFILNVFLTDHQPTDWVIKTKIGQKKREDWFMASSCQFRPNWIEFNEFIYTYISNVVPSDQHLLLLHAYLRFFSHISE